MVKSSEKIQARILRKRGISITEIAKQLNVSKGSVSIWCSDIILSEKQKRVLYENKIKGGLIGRMKGAEKKQTEAS